MVENPSITSTELAEKVGVTKRTIERTFKSLHKKKMIERIGSKRDGNWIVVRWGIIMKIGRNNPCLGYFISGYQPKD